MKSPSGLFGRSYLCSTARALSPAKIAGLALIASAALGSQAGAAVTYTGTDGGSRSASAEFSVSGDILSIRLSNTSAFDVNAPNQLLSSVYFSFLSGTTPSLTTAGGSVKLDGSQVYRNGVNVTTGPYGDNGIGDVSGEFAFKSGLTGGILGSDSFFGVSSNGMGNFGFGVGDLFPGDDLDPPQSPNGMNYGISSFGDIVNTFNGGIEDEPLVNYSVLIQLKGATGLDLSKLDNVFFQYGTDESDPSFGGSVPGNPVNAIPEPGSTAALVGLLSCGLFLRSRRRQTA